MSKENAIAAMKLMSLDDLYSYAYHMGVSQRETAENVEAWIEEWKKAKREIENLRKDLKELEDAAKDFLTLLELSLGNTEVFIHALRAAKAKHKETINRLKNQKNSLD